jgi:translation initiation factor IF-2
MAENIPNPPAGAVPPKKETGKVQPKKETVRISLPPKPSSAPTIKMPALPPGGPVAAAAAPTAPASATGVLQPGPAAQIGIARATSAPATGQKPGQTQAPRPGKAAGPRTVSTLDTSLAIAAAVAGLAAVGSVLYLMFFVFQP